MSSHARQGGVRLHAEPVDPLRGPFGVDRQRIISCTAFRRLQHKTQVFAPALHDHFRTRMTHTIEVAQIARTLGAALKVNEALAEAIALAHDLGHPPFGHAGETALAELMADHGGFNHNAHTLRVVEYLEHPFPAFRGLNLTRATLAGLRVHATRYDRPGNGPTDAPSVEAQVASLADRIAYDTHDLEDAIGAELVDHTALGSLDLWRVAEELVTATSGRLPIHALRRPVLDAVVNRLITDAVAASTGNSLSFSAVVEEHLAAVERFLLDRVYRRPEVARGDEEGRRLIHRLFNALRSDPKLLPGRFLARVEEQGTERVVCDYVAGMTDGFCRREAEKIAP